MSNSTASKLDELIGLTGAKRIVIQLATRETGVHAVLLYGARGSGTDVLADILAQAWLCRKPNEFGACGECQACQSFGRGTTPDLVRINPAQPSNIIRRGAIFESDNKADQTDFPNPIVPFFRTQPLMSRHKVAILRDVHRMNGDAANGFLKTLEEPHPHARMILTTSAVGGVLPTILSRCLAVACSLPSVEEIASRFPAATAQDVRLAEGTPGRLATILQKPELYRKVSDFATSLLRMTPAHALVASEQLKELCDQLDSALKSGARTAQGEALSLLALCLARDASFPPSWAPRVIETHRRIQANGAAGLAFDALFAEILAR